MLNEHNIILSNKCEELLEEKTRFQQKLRTEIKNSFENIYNNLAVESSEKNYYLSQEILYLYKIITEFHENNSPSREAEATFNKNIQENPIKTISDKKISNIAQYNNNNPTTKKPPSQFAYPQKFPINSLDSNQINNDLNQINSKNSAKNLATSNYSSNKAKSATRKTDIVDDSVRKVEDSISTVKEANNGTTRGPSQTTKTSNNKLDNYINKFINK